MSTAVECPAASADRLVQAAVALTAVLLGLHLWAAGHLQFMFDEAYYSLWARHLQWGYHDHPPAVAWWIRVSTMLFGTSEFGVRALGVFGTALGSVAIYAIGLDVFADRARAALAVLLWNACPLMGVGAILITPDTPLLAGWITALWGLGRVYRTGQWWWWLVVGVGAGFALEAKYSGLFLGPGLALAMAWVPALRRWWRHPAPYIGGAIALAMFVPNVVWNANHGWQTFAKQFGRVADAELTAKYIFEFVGSQVGLLNPLTFVLALAGLIWAIKPAPAVGDVAARRLLAALVLPLLAYFLMHSLHDRVQGNWMAPLYPALALLAADAAFTPLMAPAWAVRLLGAARRGAVPLGLALTAAIYLQAFLTPLRLPPQSDPTALLQGWRGLAIELDGVAQKAGAAYILTPGYALASLMKVYQPGGRPVFQFTERVRWSSLPDEGQPDAAKPGLVIVDSRRGGADAARGRFRSFTPVGKLTRRGNGRDIETYDLFLVAQPTGPILDPLAAAKR